MSTENLSGKIWEMLLASSEKGPGKLLNIPGGTKNYLDQNVNSAQLRNPALNITR